jgi:hypothetical protein
VIGNTVEETGDDMIAVVSYGAGEPKCGDILIEGNNVSGNYSGRGITVVGGKNVTIRRNTIAHTTHGAGILVNSETSWHTSDVHHVLVEDNQISHVQTTAAAYNPINMRKKTGQGAIDINGQGKNKIRDVILRGNSITDSKIGIFVRGDSCDIELERNAMNKVATPISIHGPSNESCKVSCRQNENNGSRIIAPKCMQAGSTE